MIQKPYTLKFTLGQPNKLKECRVYLRYYSAEIRLFLPTSVRVLGKYFDTSKALKNPIIKHPNAKSFNASLDLLRVEVEQRALAPGAVISADYLLGKETASHDTIYDFIERIKADLKGRVSPGTIRHYSVTQKKIQGFDKNATFKDVSLSWLQKLETHCRKTLAENSINTNMGRVVSILNKAHALGLLSKDQFYNYRRPVYKEDIPVYLTEGEIKAFKSEVDKLHAGPVKRSGMYFLLSCYTGLRISDLVKFKYDQHVTGKSVIVRAKKNGNIVSIGIYPALAEILEYCKTTPLNVPEQHMRDHVKTIAQVAKIDKHVKVHAARHSFAMLMLAKGLTIDEVAELLGDSINVARRYARITNSHLHNRIMDVMKDA